jgi:hypothetical protein
MVTTALVDSKIEAGAELLEELDRAGFPIEAALWS